MFIENELRTPLELVEGHIAQLEREIEKLESEADLMEAEVDRIRQRVALVEDHVRLLRGEVIGQTSDGVAILKPAPRSHA